MAFDQSKLFKKLENIVSGLNKEEFVYDFLLAFGSPKATITKLKNSYGSAGSLLDESVVLKNKIHFQTCEPTQNLYALCESTKKSSHISKDKIRFIIVTDFEDVVAYDTKAKDTLDVELIDLPKSYAFFLPLAGIEKFEVTSEHPADVKASYKMGQLCDVIRRHNQIDTEEKVHAFNVFLTRLLFCFYAEDTGIFYENQMIKAIQNTTEKSGKDLRSFFKTLFTILNIPENSIEREKYPTHFTDFKYVNGGLFAKNEWIPEFTDKARRMIIEIGALSWDEINPDIFGSMFQAVIDPQQRGSLGQHYTSVPNIMKVIKPLFLDELEEELDRSRNSSKKLQKLLVRLQRIRFFDPACGSGNFLIISYKEIRKLEMKVLRAMDDLGEQSEMFMSNIRLSQFYGIEIDDFAHEIAILSLWLAENQMNKLFKNEFGYSEPSLPLKTSGNIYHANSLKVDWNDICPKHENGSTFEVYLCGNPPFLGSGGRDVEQNADMANVFKDQKSHGMIDFVGCWFYKAAEYIQGENAQYAFVATNSISQGEQVSQLWPSIYKRNLHIHFAHKTFSWQNQAKQKAAVHVVIVGVSNRDNNQKSVIYSEDSDGNLKAHKTSKISPYLRSGSEAIVSSRTTPLGNVNKMVFGNKAVDFGNLILSVEEKKQLLEASPKSEKWIKRLLGADEFINSKERYCLWLVNVSTEEIETVKEVSSRVEKVRNFRLNSKKKATQRKAVNAHLFDENRQPTEGNYLLVPRVSSERRKYVPIGFLPFNVICSDANQMVPNATLFEFAILTSEMHNDWMRTVAGRLKSDYRYSASLVYNTFPWPEFNEKQKENIEKLAEEVLLVRADHVEKTLGQMYDPDKMPEDLREAHKELDIAVEKLYRNKPFENEAERVEFLFKRYEELISKERNNA
ncbi:DNA methyltransferase [Pseudoalteromonas sp. G24-MNA-CIBAN-0072]|uniref:class I SAM-dependent DNA methyltransferase n=2 Tax=unclassified Pseudoalteromonas TaxID=194690 RepID=UPI0033266992